MSSIFCGIDYPFSIELPLLLCLESLYSQGWWLLSIISAVLEVEIRRVVVQGQQGQKFNVSSS
jgi:hypothetical protein